MSTKELRKRIKGHSLDGLIGLTKDWSDQLVIDMYYKMKRQKGHGPEYLADELVRRGLVDKKTL